MADPIANRTLANRLREAREYLGFSQVQAAEHLGLHRAAVSEIETGRRKVTAEEFAKLCKLYQRPMHYFLGGEIETTGLPASLVEHLTPEDRSEVEELARFLQWRRKQRKETR